MSSNPLRRAVGMNAAPVSGGRGRGIRSIAVGIVAFTGLLTSPQALAQNAPEITERRDATAVVETVDGMPHPGSVPELLLPGRALLLDGSNSGRRAGAIAGVRIDGTMTTTYETETPQSVRSVIDAAVGAWDEALALSPTAPVEISVRWTNLGPRLLGQAGTEGEYRNAEKFPTDRWYPAALANQLANTDVNGPDTPEVLVELNSGLGEDWYIGTDGRPGFGQIDLYSVVLHEIAHGLGFLGSAIKSKDGTVRLDHGSPSIYDDFVMTSAGIPLSDLEPDVAVEALTSESLRFDVGFGRAMPIHSPSRFVNGSSYSHFEESIGSDEAGAMMTPALKNGESQRKIDAAVLGVLDQIGWSLDLKLLEPTISDVNVRSGGLEFAWTEDWKVPGAFAARYDLAVTPLASSGEQPDPTIWTSPGERSSSLELDGLQNGTSYRLSITAARDGTPSGVGVDTTFLLPPNPNPVRDLKLKADSPRALSWLQPVASGEPVTSYEVNYREASQRQWKTATVTETSWDTALPSGRYWFRVRGVNRVGSGIWRESPLLAVSTGPARPMPLDGQLARLYEAYFERSPDAGGLDYWRQLRAESLPLAVVSDQFSASREFINRYGSLDDPEFVARLYQNVLDRSPDESGYEYWLGLLDDGFTRGTIVLWFSESAEFIRLTGTVAPQTAAEGAAERIHLALLRRAPTVSELDDLIAEQATLQNLVAELVKLTEFTDVWGSETDEELLAGIAESISPRRSASMVRRLQAGDTFEALIVELTNDPSYIAATGTAP